MASERQALELAIAALEQQRGVLGDAVTNAALAPLNAKLAALEPTAAAHQTLRLVTVLFLDVVGSTALAQRLDAEDMHAVVDGLLARCTGVVQTHEGKVLQYAGDSLLAVFGADQAREDDAERALRCGLALLVQARQHAEQVAQPQGVQGVDVRIGVHTGRVLLGGGVDAEHSIRGSTVHIAARMEQSAPPGGMRISHDTYRHVRGVFDVQTQPPLTVKGLDEPLVTYLVQRAKPRAFRVATRGIEGVETRMIGRDAELEQLQDAFKRVYSEGKLVSVTVVAEAGLGKSRLLYEFENWAEARPEPFYIFQGRAHPQTRSQPYGLLRDVLAWRLQIDDGESASVAKQKFEQGLTPLFQHDHPKELASAHAHLLGHLIGLDFSDSKHLLGIKDDAKQIRNRAFHAAAQMFRRIADQNRSPVVLLLDDLHFADDGSLEFLSYLGQVNRDVPMLVVGLTRPSLFEQASANSQPRAAVQRIDLRPLDKGVSRLLVNELLKKLDEIPSTLRELIAGGGEGNPFYMEELVKMLVDEGAIQVGALRWSVNPAKLVATQVPQTLTGVLQARLDGLKSASRLALQQASVIGFVFWDRALGAIDASAPEALPGLVERELVVPHPDSNLDGARAYAFKHQILHHVTYDTVLKRHRRDYHAKAAAWLAQLGGARANDFLGVTAQQYEKAGDTEHACEWFARAAEHAKDRYAHEAALSYVAQALALMGTDAGPGQGDDADAPAKLTLRWRLLDVRERTFDLLGRRAEQVADIAALEEIAQALNDARRRGEAAWRRSDYAMRTADYRTQESAARQAIGLAAQAADAVLGLRAQLRLAIAVSYLGDAARGKGLALEGLAKARALGLRALESLLLNTLSVIGSMQDDLLLSLEMDQQRLLIDRELGNQRNEAISHGNLGSEFLSFGDDSQARHHLEEGLRLTRAVGDRGGEATLLGNLSKLSLRQGEEALALAYAHSSLEIGIAVQNPSSEAFALCCLGNAELALGRQGPAAAAFERARAVALEFDDGQQYDAVAGSARMALLQGDLAAAMALVETLLTQSTGGGTLASAEAPRLIQLTCYQVLARAGDPRAPAVLATAHGELQAKAASVSNAALRHSFLKQIPENREIIAAWIARSSAAHD